jgi:uncharacterized protein YaiI (UPF0178 family)
MQILVDADACPHQIQKTITSIARDHALQCLFVSSYAHFSYQDFQKDYLYVDKSSQAVDLVIANRVQVDDIVVTQDYGLAALVLAKGGKAISTRGMVYSKENIEQLLEQRHITSKIRKGGGRILGPAKITQQDVERFRQNFSRLIRSI